MIGSKKAWACVLMIAVTAGCEKQRDDAASQQGLRKAYEGGAVPLKADSYDPGRKAYLLDKNRRYPNDVTADEDAELRGILRIDRRKKLPPLERMVGALKAEEPVIRRRAAEDLEIAEDPRAVGPLVEALRKEPFAEVRQEIVRTLGMRPDRETRRMLSDTLRSREEHPSVRATAAEALGTLREAQSVPLLIDIFRARTEPVAVRGAALRAVRNIGDVRALEALLTTVRDEDPIVRLYAVRALAVYDDPHASNALLAVISKDPSADVRQAAILGSVKSHEPKVFEVLAGVLGRESASTRRNVVDALKGIVGPQPDRLLLAALDDPDRGVRHRAVRAWQSRRDPQARGDLVSGLKRSLTDWFISPEAVRKLDALGWTAQSDDETVHALVARRDGGELRRKWDVAKPVLLADARSGRPETIENAVLALVGLGKDEVIPLLLQQLDNSGSITIATVYANSGNAKLAEAARGWGREHGRKVVRSPRWNLVTWGSLR